MIAYVIIFIIILIGIISYLRGENIRNFNKYYYRYVDNFDIKYFDSLDEEGQYDYYQLLIVTRDLVIPTKKNSTLNQQINKVSEIISYIEKNYGEVWETL